MCSNGNMNSEARRREEEELRARIERTQRILEFEHAVAHNKVTDVERMLNSGLKANTMVPIYVPGTKFTGYTLLYLACVNNRLEIISKLLKAGANPAQKIESNEPPLSPYGYAVVHRNRAVMSVLLRDNKVRAYPREYQGPDYRIHYDMFREFHDNLEVVHAITQAKPENPDEPDLYEMLESATRCRSLRLCRHLLCVCGVVNAIDTLLEDLHCPSFTSEGEFSTSALSYVIAAHGVRNCLENEVLRHRLLVCRDRNVLDTLLCHCYRIFGDDKAWWEEQMLKRWTYYRQPPHQSFLHVCLRDADKLRPLDALDTNTRFGCLLRWGFFSVSRDHPRHGMSLFYGVARTGILEDIKLFVCLYPQCLQEEWFRSGVKPWLHSTRRFTRLWGRRRWGGQGWAGLVSQHTVLAERKKMIDDYFLSLMERSLNVPSLKELCRSVIFQELGINPIPKAWKLPLPRVLMKYVQCQDLH